jgi:methylenetetrahydrofolate dehydrogenase (NADP+)/methenyltetrahydrofolate cyclohydrolase
LKVLGADPDIHGILPLLPFPAAIKTDELLQLIPPQKDVDGVTALSQAWIYAGAGTGFAPCTAAAVMELIHYYRIPLDGLSVTVLGRSNVIGKPLALLLLRENATVTVCHSRSRFDTALSSELCVCATGKIGAMENIKLQNRPILIDCGINTDAEGKLCGDLTVSQQQAAFAYTPVPGGVGAVTVAVLGKHLAEACIRALILR